MKRNASSFVQDLNLDHRVHFQQLYTLSASCKVNNAQICELFRLAEARNNDNNKIESLLVVTQNNAMRTNCVKARIDKCNKIADVVTETKQSIT